MFSYAGMLYSDPWMGVVCAPPRDFVVQPPEGGHTLVLLHLRPPRQPTQLVCCNQTNRLAYVFFNAIVHPQKLYSLNYIILCTCLFSSLCISNCLLYWCTSVRFGSVTGSVPTTTGWVRSNRERMCRERCRRENQPAPPGPHTPSPLVLPRRHICPEMSWRPALVHYWVKGWGEI